MRLSRLEFYKDREFGEFREGSSQVHQVQRTWLEKHSLSGHLKLLDIGCGTGAGTRLVASGHTGECIIFGIDVSMSSLNTAFLRSINPILAEIDVSNLPVQDNSMDVVILDEVIEHVVETDRLLGEIYRVLVPGGLLLLSTPNLAAWFNRIALLLGIQPAYSEVSFRKIYGRPGSEVVGHLRLFTLKSLVELVEDSGFNVRKVKGVTFPALPRALHGIDTLFKSRTSLAAGIVLSATKQG